MSRQKSDKYVARFSVVLLSAWLTFAQGVSPSRPTPPPESSRRIVLDTDPGIDDAIAILLALRSPELHVEAITTVAGNVPVEVATENARKMVDLAGRSDVIVAKGAARPLQRRLATAELIHGEGGLGGVVLPPATVPLDRRHAVEVIRDVINSNAGRITLLAIGPLTNVAMAFLQYPDLAAKTREIVMVSGTVGAGLATPLAEPNIYRDAEAAKIVFESGVPIFMVDLTAGAQARFTRDHAAYLAKSGDPIAQVATRLWQPYLEFAQKMGSGSAAIYDPLGVGIAVDRQIAKVIKPIHVDVETKGEFSYGATVTNSSLTAAKYELRGDRHVLVGFSSVSANAAYPVVVDGERLVRMLLERLTKAPARPK